MGYYTEISNSQYAAKDTALQNRLNGVQGHTLLGVMLSSNATGIFGLVTSFAGNSNSDVTGPDVEVDTTDINKSSANIATFTAAMKAFGKTPSKENAQALQNAYNADPKNPTIARLYNNYKADVEKLV